MFIMTPVIIPNEIASPKQKIVYGDTPYELDTKVNLFIETVTKEGFKIISISVDTIRQEYYHYTTTIIYG